MKKNRSDSRIYLSNSIETQKTNNEKKNHSPKHFFLRNSERTKNPIFGVFIRISRFIRKSFRTQLKIIKKCFSRRATFAVQPSIIILLFILFHFHFIYLFITSRWNPFVIIMKLYYYYSLSLSFSFSFVIMMVKVACLIFACANCFRSDQITSTRLRRLFVFA